ncbi:Hypothetical protein FSTVST1_415 [Faustovirus ST1]|nr:Hypothetical protein FSTVST1_415 [Faustovirus ST1]
MLCSKELIKDYLNIYQSNDLLSRILAGKEVAGVNYARRSQKSHHYVSFSYIYNQRNYLMDISCNLLDKHFTTLDNRVCTKQSMYENIFAYDRSYVAIIANEYFTSKLNNDHEEEMLGDLFITSDDTKYVGKYIDVIKLVSLRVKFGRFDFSELWEMERNLDNIQWFDLEINVRNCSGVSLNHAGEIRPVMKTCKYPIMVNSGKIIHTLDHDYDEVLWALRVIYSGSIITSELSASRVILLRDMGIDTDGIIASCICFISKESQTHYVEFVDSKML